MTPNYDFILPFYCGNDSLRPLLNIPNLDENGYVYATNAHVLIKVKKENLINEYKTEPKYPNAEKMFSQLESSETVSIKTESIISLLSMLKWYKQQLIIDCEKCDGQGEIECSHCGHDSECKECNGTGYTEKGDLQMGLLIKSNYDSIIKIGTKYFDPNLIHIIAISAAILHEDTITMHISENNLNANIFVIKEAQIIVMPKLSDDGYNEVLDVKYQ